MDGEGHWLLLSATQRTMRLTRSDGFGVCKRRPQCRRSVNLVVPRLKIELFDAKVAKAIRGYRDADHPFLACWTYRVANTQLTRCWRSVVGRLSPSIQQGRHGPRDVHCFA